MKHCRKCNSLMPEDAPRCIKCGSESVPAAAEVSKKPAAGKPAISNATQDPRRINWLRIFAVVLSSKLFFIVSCTAGMAVGSIGHEGTESGTHGGKVRPLDTRLAIIAVVPDASRAGANKIVQTSLRHLEKFKQDDPAFSFLPPPGKGELSERGGITRTEYAIASDGPGKVLVETTFHDDEHHVLGRYAATDKEITPLYTRFKHDFIAFWYGMAIGLPLAITLGLVGSFLNRRLKLQSGEATAAAQVPSRFGRLVRLIALSCMWLFIFLVVVELLSIIARKAMA